VLMEGDFTADHIDADLAKVKKALKVLAAAYRKLCEGVGAAKVAEWDKEVYKVSCTDGEWSSPFTLRKNGTSYLP
jgi:hypothetical protein